MAINDWANHTMIMDFNQEGVYDLNQVSTPSVIKDGSTYKMWYSLRTNPTWRIGYATSADGITWANETMVMNIGAEGTYDTSHVAHPCVIKEGATYKMWYAGHDGSKWRILYATSSNGTTWTGHTMVLSFDVEGTYDKQHIYGPHVINDDGTYKIWYTGMDNSNIERIMYASSDDGVSWSNHAMTIDIGDEGTYDTADVLSPTVIKDEGTYRIWYTGYTSAYRILYATSSDGINWSGHTMVIDKNIEGVYDVTHANHAAILNDGLTWRMYYAGYSGSSYRIMYASMNILEEESWKTHNDGISSFQHSASYAWYGQTWLTTSAYSLGAFEFDIKKIASPVNDIWIELYATTAGTPSGLALATSDKIASNSIPASLGTWTRFIFSTPYALSDATTYAAILVSDNVVNGVNFFQMQSDTTNPYAGGSQWRSSDGLTWNAVAARDAIWIAYSSSEEGGGPAGVDLVMGKTIVQIDLFMGTPIANIDLIMGT